MSDPVVLVLNEKEDGTYSIDNAPDVAAFTAELIYSLAAGQFLGVAVSSAGVEFLATNGVFKYVFRTENIYPTNSIIGDLVKE